MAAEAGWYPDPMGDVTKLRYWDGAAWTDHYAPAQGQPAAEGAQPAEAAQPTVTVNVQQAAVATPVTYPMTETDRTMRLIAFILNIVSAVAACWLLVPLAWMIPMTVVSYGIYKGTRPNSVAFGVCTLLFVNIVSGILLLCTNKDK